MNLSTGFSKTLARYYHKWYRDCHDSAVYCKEKGQTEKSKEYLERANHYFKFIINNWDAIEFFSIEDNAFKIDSALPTEFQNYK